MEIRPNGKTNRNENFLKFKFFRNVILVLNMLIDLKLELNNIHFEYFKGKFFQRFG